MAINFLKRERSFRSLEIEEDTILYKMHHELSKKGRNVLSLRASEVVDFSSQYGSNESLSYTADNIIGPPTIFPETGDNAYSYQMRTYGDWWQILPSCPKTNVILPPETSVESQDFIEFRVEKRVVPLLLRVYEVYNPGSIVRIFCYCYETSRWVVMWKGEPQVLPPEKSHCFAVEAEGIDFPTDHYRIEFHHKHLDYFCEIDGLILYGEIKISEISEYFPSYSLQNASKKKIKPQNSVHDTEALASCTSETSQNPSLLESLPSEVMYLIFSYLDLRSLCTLSRVSRLFRKLCYDPVLYRDLNLQLYWHLTDVKMITSLQPRLESLRKLNLAWCGGQGRIPHTYFIEFVGQNCYYLTSLKLSNCHFVNSDSLKAVAKYCPFLKELELQCCRANDLTQTGFRYIAQITNLTYLDLYRTLIDKASIICIIKALKLEHLLLGGCSNINGINDVAKAIGKYLSHSLKTLDLWRATDLTCVGMYEIAEHCSNLVELDLGWCYQVDASCGCIRQLITHCSKLKKLFLTAIRTISNTELTAIAIHCPDMEQLDILGTTLYNIAGLKKVLYSCKNLKLLDVSYPATEVKVSLPTLEALFPTVKIKCSLPRSAQLNGDY